MAYITGVSASLTDLVNAVVSAAVANGFTAGPTWTYTAVAITYDVRSLVKDGVTFNLAVPQTGAGTLRLNTMIGSPSMSAALIAQPLAAPTDALVSNLTGPHIGYHIFIDELAVHVAVEFVTNVFVHFALGYLDKNGAWDGGAFVAGHQIGPSVAWGQIYNNGHELAFINTQNVGGVSGSITAALGVGHVRTPVNGPVAAVNRSGGSFTSSMFTTATAANAGRQMLDVTPNLFNGRAALIPINYVQAASGGSGGPFYQMGTVRSARVVNIKNLDPKETVNTDWMVFPVSQKNGPATSYLNSGNVGLAYKK